MIRLSNLNVKALSFRVWILPFVLGITVACSVQKSKVLPYKNPTLPIHERVNDLVSRMTLQEKVSQMVNNAAAIPRLGIPPYHWWNECLHGVMELGTKEKGFDTVFPQVIGLGATWDSPLIHNVAVAISDEARAKYNQAIRKNSQETDYGLTFFSPNVNIVRDPRWGRGQETYGEDPFLTSEMGVAYVKGLQGDDPHYLKLVATPKHFAVHSGPESERLEFDARVSDRDLRETYLPAFEACIREGHAFSIMCAYSALDGKPCCANPPLLDEILRKQWGFGGYVVSDCSAISDIFNGHHFGTSLEQASVLAVKAGTDLSCGNAYLNLVQGVKDGLISDSDINRAVKRLFEARFRLGMFDPPAMVPYSKIPASVIDNPEHRELALKAARESIVLLRNANHLLPLRKNLRSIAVIGPNADVEEVLLGNYHGIPSKAVTPLQGIRSEVSPSTKVLYAQGCNWVKPSNNPKLFADAIQKARQADVSILVMGINSDLESEQSTLVLPGFYDGDRTDLALPRVQEKLLQAVQATGKPVVLVLMNGSAMAVNWAALHIPAIVEAWYPGEEGGTAIANVLFGDYDPAGRLPVTFYKSVDQLPPFEDYNMAGRTYRYFKGEPLYPFGYGLSYTQFAYSGLKFASKKISSDENQHISVKVRNVGKMAGDEIVELYVSHLHASVPVPIRSLEGFTRIHLAPGESREISFKLTPRQLSEINNLGHRVVEPGTYEASVGGEQPGFKGATAAVTTEVLTGEFEVTGKVAHVKW